MAFLFSTHRLFLQPSEQCIDGDVPVRFVDRFCQRKRHRTNLYAVLRVTAVGNAVVTEESVQSFVHVHLADRMHIEQPGLADSLRPDVIAVSILRASLKAAAAGHAS